MESRVVWGGQTCHCGHGRRPYHKSHAFAKENSVYPSYNINDKDIANPNGSGGPAVLLCSYSVREARYFSTRLKLTKIVGTRCRSDGLIDQGRLEERN